MERAGVSLNSPRSVERVAQGVTAQVERASMGDNSKFNFPAKGQVSRPKPAGIKGAPCRQRGERPLPKRNEHRVAKFTGKFQAVELAHASGETITGASRRLRRRSGFSLSHFRALYYAWR